MTKSIEIVDNLIIRDDLTAKQIYDNLRHRGLNPKYNYGIQTECGLVLPYISIILSGDECKMYFESEGEKAKLRKVVINKSLDTMTRSQDIVLYKRHWWD